MSGARPAELLRKLEQAVLPPADEADDRTLLERFTRGRDQTAFATLVRRHGPMVLSVCRRVTAHPQDAEDAFQAVFLVLARKAGGLRNAALVGNWLYGVAVRVSRRARRAAARRRGREVQVPTLPDPAAPPVDASPDIGPVLHEELAGLPGWYREAIVLCDLRGFSREDAAKALGVPEGTLSSRLANGRKKLADRLAKRGIALSAAAVPTALAGGAVAAVPDSLVAQTCGLVADWAAGGVVPVAVGRLAKGGFTVRKLVLLGAMTSCLAAVGVVLAGKPEDPPKPADPPKPVAEKKAEPKTVPILKPDDKEAAGSGSPRLQTVADVSLSNPVQMAWSPDGKWLAIRGKSPSDGPGGEKTPNTVMIVDAADVRLLSRWVHLPPDGKLVGFTPDSKLLVTAVQESNLISGEHRLDFWELFTPWGLEHIKPENPPGGMRKVRSLDLEGNHTLSYSFVPGGGTVRTVVMESPPQEDGYHNVQVRDLSLETGRVVRTVLRIPGPVRRWALSPDSQRFGVIDTDHTLVMWDADRGVKVWEKSLLPDEADPKTPRPLGKATWKEELGRLFGNDEILFSPDHRRVACFRGMLSPLVLDVEAGTLLSTLEGTKRTIAGVGGFTADNRLLAVAGSEGRERGWGGTAGDEGAAGKKGRDRAPGAKGPGAGMPAQVSITYERFVAVWDVTNGKRLKAWPGGEARVAFRPSGGAVLAVVENNRNSTRLGFWDFAAKP
jgi:RNA polymerase sigma factor (sigma-70 family)